ncbi:UDP-N-acetylmuramate--L-alanine ligase [Candidatus Kinetoplastibacterium sorsogonicusi]|uniref:UDP-N-acetylmuramate--L-alanine ligase n=1 Tax=Candidatus Kinetoplastidibacterium kentomonadis TaxID=1576550 RepID=A0A3S7JAF8_9PROT|nr:UDP-N-acetylmuramate--L-alanine ligase [Candidatus Kinetoplastibacterium sorsogonicusi]AWD32658.1 UDP-N-acetylmuramate--L-alanine ligase [Candidatus Kinetoplastibacterium sorsogonicusi]
MKNKIKHIHFVGIGGSGMNGIAELLLNLNYTISGSDLFESNITSRLKSMGANIYIGHASENILGADVLVVSSAISNDNPEVCYARQKNIPIVPRAIMLAELMRLKRGIAVAGTHGKTTTTSLVSSILAYEGLDPTFVIGGKLNAIGTSAVLGQGDYIIVEADESDASFLDLSPIISIVTNIGIDHMDTYNHNINILKNTFINFIHKLPFYGTAILCIDDINIKNIIPNISRTAITYGLDNDANIKASNIQCIGTRMLFHVERKNINGIEKKPLDITLNLPGIHNVRNALAAIAVATELDIKDHSICLALKDFRGVSRRFSYIGDFNVNKNNGGGLFTIIDDYGHHPMEIQATLDAARGIWPDRRIVLAFQPHRYTRTRDCFEDFIKVLSNVDVLLLTEVYSAGEKAIIAADGRSLSRALRVFSKIEPIFVENIENIPKIIMNIIRDKDVLIIMGAGSISKVHEFWKKSI